MASPGPTESAEDHAARWAVHSAYGDMTPEHSAELEAWLAADRRHRGAYLRARAGLHAMEDAVVAGSAAPAPDRHGAIHPAFLSVGRPRWIGKALAGGAALAASVAALVAFDVPLVPPSGKTEIAAAEEVVNLKDGSIATLRHDAKIAVALSDDYRRITLLSGEATFKVAKDKARPFVVQSGQVYAQATGTVYSVRRVGATGGTVKVSEGSVLVWQKGERSEGVMLHAGGTLTLDPGPGVATRVPETAAPPGPQPAQISLDNVPIRSAVLRFNRVNGTQIILDDPAIGDVHIVGLFKADDPQQFARAAAAISGRAVAYDRGNIVIK